MIDRDAEEEVLDRWLSQLMRVEQEQGFQQRMTEGLEARRVRRQRLQSPWLRWSLARVAALAIAAIWGLMALHEPARLPVPLIAEAPVPPAQPSAARVTRSALRVVQVRHKDRVRAVAGHQAATSFPAPQAPLTAEERLLVEVSHTTKPEEIASLDSEERAVAEHKEQVAFHRFFDPEPRPRRVEN